MKILISAYSCEPGQGSERGIGWNIVRAIARYHQVWVLTRPDESAECIEQELTRNPNPNLQFVYFTLPVWSDGWRRGQGAILLHYYLWQIQAYFVARKLHRQINFDLTQHVTFIKYSIPSFLSLLPIPFVWGPVGGGESAPKAFLSTFSKQDRIYETLRTLACGLGELDPFVHICTRRSAVALAATEQTAVRLKALKSKKIRVYSPCGLSPEEIEGLASLPKPPAEPLRFISIGRLLHWKGFHLGLEAFARANISGTEYWVVGDGPEREGLKSLSQNLGIDSKVKFWGSLPREETFSYLGKCHVLVHPSLHDSGGLVCLEAMAASRPVICLDLGGPGILVTEETGFKVSSEEPERSVKQLAEAMVSLASNPDLRRKLGKAAEKRVKEEYDWAVKGHFFALLYEQVFQESRTK